MNIDKDKKMRMVIVENENKFKKCNVFISEMFFQIVFEGITIVSVLECFQGFVPKRWSNVRQSKLTIVSLVKRTL